MIHTIKWKCAVCGKLTAGRLPRQGRQTGDGSFWYPRRHKINGVYCGGNIIEAILYETVKTGISSGEEHLNNEIRGRS